MKNIKYGKHIWPLLFFCVCCSFLGLSQQLITLDEAITIGLANNYQIQILQTNQEIAKNNNTAANADFLPTVSAVGTYSFSNTNTKQEFFNGESRSATGAGSRNARAAAEANWVIFDGYRRQALSQQFDLEELRSSELINAETLQFLEAVQLHYYQLAQLQKEIALTKKSIQLNQSIQLLARQKQQIGVGSESEVLQATSQLNADSIILIGQEGQLAADMIALNHLINQPLSTKFMVDTSLQIQPLPSQQLMLEEARRRNPALLLSQLDQLNTDFQIKELKSVLYPKLSLNAAYTYNFSKAEVGFLLSNRTFGPSSQLTFSYDIYSGRNLKNELRNIDLVKSNIQRDQQQVELDIASRIAEIYANCGNLLNLELAIKRDIAVAERNTLLANELYRQGRNTSFEVREAVLREIQTRGKLIQTTYGLKYLEIRLHSIAGILGH
jgi:outer membrane protein TolC